jgi:predicted Rossmann-fold nucleotide-binding protein
MTLHTGADPRLAEPPGILNFKWSGESVYFVVRVHAARESCAMAATSLARCLAHNGIAILYGGGKIGLKGKVADAALAEVGRSQEGDAPQCRDTVNKG